MARSFALLALAGAVVAQPTVDLLNPFADTQKLEATVIGAQATITTYVLNCPTNAPQEDCGMPMGGMTISQGPSTWGMGLGVTAEDSIYSQTAECKLNSAKDEAVCSASVYESYDGTVTSTSTDALTMDYKTLMFPVTVVSTDSAAAPKTTSAAPEPTYAYPASSETESAASSTETESVASSTSAQTTLATKAPSSSKPAVESPTSGSDEPTTSPPTGAAGRMTPQNLILAGAAAIIGGVMML